MAKPRPARTPRQRFHPEELHPEYARGLAESLVVIARERGELHPYLQGGVEATLASLEVTPYLVSLAGYHEGGEELLPLLGELLAALRDHARD